MTEPIGLDIVKIRLDGDTQARSCLHEDMVSHYAERMADGDVFRPVDVFFDGRDYWLADGFHRVHAALKNSQSTVSATLHQGTRRDAVWFALSANRNNGLPMGLADRQRALRLALEMFPDKSDSVIARHVGVHRTTVANHRLDLDSTCRKPTSRTGQDGRTISVAKIGRPQAGQPAEVAANNDEIPFEVPAPAGKPVSSPVVDIDGPLAGPLPEKPEAPTDQVGKPLPAKLVLDFQRTGEITRLATAVSQIKSVITKAVDAGDPLYADLNVSAFMADIGNVYRRVADLKPYAVCPYCGGDGCRTCKNRGWVSRITYEVAPKELR